MRWGANSGLSKFEVPGKRMVQVFLEKELRLGMVVDVGRVEPSQVYD